MGKFVVGVFLGVAGACICAVSIWMLVDTFSLKTSMSSSAVQLECDSSKIGIAAGILTFIMGVAVCVVDAERYTYHTMAGIFVAAVLSLATFGMAIKENKDARLVRDILRTKIGIASGHHSIGISGRDPGESAVQEIIKEFEKVITQTTVMAVFAGVGVVVKALSMYLVFRGRPDRSYSSGMQMARKG